MIVSARLDLGTDYIKFLNPDWARIWNFSFKVYPKEEFGPKKFIKPWRTGTKSQQQIPPRGQKKGFRVRHPESFVVLPLSAWIVFGPWFGTLPWGLFGTRKHWNRSWTRLMAGQEPILIVFWRFKSPDPLGRRRLEWWFFPLSLLSFDSFDPF